MKRWADLRLLTNFDMDADRRLCLLLVGLAELRRRLSMAVHESLSQRLVCATTSAVDSDDKNLRRRKKWLTLTKAASTVTNSRATSPTVCDSPGANCRCFDPPAVEALYQGSRGPPRQINRIAHYALSAAALDKARTVNAGHLEHALEELRP